MVVLASSSVAATGVIAGVGTQIAGAGVGALAGTFVLGGLALATGGLLVGANEIDLTFDCWKDVVHHHEKTPSRGMELEKLLSDKRIVEVYQDKGDSFVQNKWDEIFKFSGVLINNILYLHAKQV